MISEKLTISKFMRKFKALKAKNRNDLIDKKLLLFAENSTISNLSTQLSF